MAAPSQMRQQIIDNVIEALQNAGDSSTIDVRLEGKKVVVVINTSGDGRAAPAPRTGHTQATKPVAQHAEAALPDDTSDKVMSVLNEGRNQKGLNLTKLAKAVGVKKKATLKPVVAKLIKEKHLKKVGQLLRRTDVEVHRGRKSAAEAKPEKAAPKKIAKASSAAAAAPTIHEEFTHEAIAQVLRDHAPGYSMVELTRQLGASAVSKMALKPLLAQMMKLSGDSQVEKKGPFYRLKNMERKPGRKAKGEKEASTPKATGKRGPGRPKGSKNATAKAVHAEKPAKRGPGRPKGSKNTTAKAAKPESAAKVEKSAKADQPAKRGPGRPKGSKNAKRAAPAARSGKSAKAEARTSALEKLEAAEEKSRAAEESSNGKKEASLSELMKAAKAREQAELKRVPIEEEERNEGAD